MAGFIEQSKLFFGDPAYYKSLADEFKRHSGAVGPKKYANTSIEANVAIQKHYKRLLDGAGNLMDKITGTKPIYRTAIFNDVMTYSQQIVYIADTLDKDNAAYQKAKANKTDDALIEWIISNAKKEGLKSAAYLDMTEGDGFGYISLDAYRDLKVRVGDWSDDAEKLYQWEVYEYNNTPKKDRTYTNSSGVTTSLRYGDWGKQVFHSLKPQYFGPMAEVGFRTTMYKTSLMPLLPSVIKGRNLEALHKHMVDNQVSILTHYSANKGVTTKTKNIDGVNTTNSFYDVQGNFGIQNGYYLGDPGEFLTQDTYVENWGIQVDTGEKSHTDVITGTQMMVHILNGLFDGGSIADDVTKSPEEKAYIQDRVDEYFALNNERISLGVERLKDILGVDITGSEYSFSREGVEKLLDMLTNDAITQDMPDNYFEAINILKKQSPENVKLDLLPNKEAFESTLLSIASKNTIKQKRKGFAALQVAATMWESGSRKKIGGMLAGSDLKFVVSTSKEGVRTSSMEVYIPDIYKGKIKIGDAIDSRLLQLIGFRIPTQGLSSIDSIIVKDFLPKEAGDIIVLPTEIVAKAGSDFDADKMYLYTPNWFFDKDGNVAYVDYAN